MPWMAAASPNKLSNFKSPNSKPDNSPSFALTGSIVHGIQDVRSAIESRFNKPKTPNSPRSPFYEPRHDHGLSRQPRIHRVQVQPLPLGDHHHYQHYGPRTADPHLPQYDFRLPSEKFYHSRPEKRSARDVPPPRYEARNPPSHQYYDSRSPKSPSHWPNEKTPTSPYYPRQPPRSPASANFNLQVPHTAHPGGSFPRVDPRDQYYRKPSPGGNGSLSAAQQPPSSDKRRFGFLDFEKVKQALSPNSGSTMPDYHEPIPSPRTPSARPRDTRRFGYYEYKTPGNANFDFNPNYAEEPRMRTPQGERAPAHEDVLVVPVPDDEKYDPEKDVEPSKGSKGVFENWLAQSRLWLASRFQKRKSRIPSVQADPELQSLEELEKNMRESRVLAWTTLIGAWLIQFTTFGYIWSWGVFQDFYMNNYPEAHSVGRLAWIGSLQLVLAFAFGIVSGKMFDAGWFRFTMMLGSLLFGVGVFSLSFVDPTKFFPLFLVQGFFMGTGLGLVFVPSVLICQLHFKERKALMTGIVMSGSSFGAMVYPIMLDRLLPPQGFGGAVRASSYMVIALLVIANCLVAEPPKQWSPRYPAIDLLSYLKERQYALICAGIFLSFLTMWFPQYYIEEFAVKHGVDPHLSFYSLAVVSVAGMIGRIVMGLAADKYGPWNMLVPTTVMVGAMVCAVVSVKSVHAIIIVSLLYGFVSGAWLSLLISGLSSMATRTGELGHRTGFALTVASFGSFLTGPAQAGLLSDKWVWARPVGLFAFLLFVTAGIFVYARHLIAQKRRFKFV